MDRLRRLRLARSRGQGIVEFALILPIFLVLVLGTIDLGRLVFDQSMINNAVRDGARYAMINPSGSTCASGSCGATTRVQSASIWFGSQITVCSAVIYADNPLGSGGTINPPSCANSGSSTQEYGYVTVVATMPYAPFENIFGANFNLTLRAQSTMMFQS